MNERWLQTLLAKDELLGRTRSTRAFSSCGAYVRTCSQSFDPAEQRTGEEPLLNLSSNDYLGLANDKKIVAAGIAAASEFGASASASRVVCGTTTLHEQFESALASFVGFESALVFNSGYAANAGLLSATTTRHDTVYIDKLAHASLLDGVRLTGARMVRYAHNDLDDLARLIEIDQRTRMRSNDGRRFLITESVFSMDGDLSPLNELFTLAESIGAYVIVDEAHSLGIFGEGRGLVRELGCLDRVFAVTGTFGKAFGSHGGVVLGSSALASLMRNRARTMLFDTAISPFHLGAASAALEAIRANPEQGRSLLAKSKDFSTALRRLIPFCMEPTSQILPVILGDPRLVTDVRDALLDEGIIVAAIRQPTVPVGTDRLRLSVSLAHQDRDLQNAAKRIAETVDRFTRSERSPLFSGVSSADNAHGISSTHNSSDSSESI